MVTLSLIIIPQLLVCQTPADDQSWEIAFQDLFTDESTFDDIWWSGAYNTNTLLHCPAVPACELQAYERTNVIYQYGGGLKLQSLEEDVTRLAERWEDSTEVLCDGIQNLRDFEYTSGAITSKTRYGYGFFEIRCKIPKGLGYWPAFWMHYAGQEIDVLEPSGSQSVNCTEYGANVYLADDCPLEQCKYPDTIFASSNLSTNFHKYAVEWTPGLVIFYLDDVPKRYVKGNMVPNVSMHVIANLAISPWSGVNYPFSEKSFDIEYIKIYSLKKNCTEDVISNNFNFNTHNYSLKRLYQIGGSTVPTGSSVTLRAVNSIELVEGFEVPLGAKFNAMIIPYH